MKDSNTWTNFFSPNTQRKTWEHMVLRIQARKVICLFLSRVFPVGTEDGGHFLDIEPDLRHSPLIINESGCHTKAKSMTTPREKLQDKVVLYGGKSQTLKKEDATRYRSASMRLSCLAQNRLDLAETAEHLAQRMSQPRDFEISFR